MTPERWHRVTELFHAARVLDSGRQDGFLADACGADAALKDAVRAMLTAHRRASSIDIDGLRGPVAVELPVELRTGELIGPYRIEAPIGAGGMGVVYRGRDLTLGRDVAIKVLPSRLATDPDRLARLAREAVLLAALNHPNIATILAVERDGHTPALVLEFVEGPTLADILESGAMPVPEALRVAAQVASGLAAAHDKGIIHRDLKPANIALRPDRVVKLLDFGLGKASGNLPTDAPVDELSTLARDETQPGTVVGTPAYMSPEQARGAADVDRRTDVWAFGCVLYEMLCGRPAFAGETASDTIVAILDREPDWNALPDRTPDIVLRLLKRCLTKDPAERMRDLADARLDVIDGQSSIRDATRWAPPARSKPFGDSLNAAK
ncbi:MAG TPA: serine/threonine-protein kinase [Vicinamibacterales bacterium]